MSDQKRLIQTITRWTQQAEAAKTPDDLQAITTAMVDYGEPIKFKLAPLKLAALVLVALAGLTFFKGDSSDIYLNMIYQISHTIGFGYDTVHFWIVGLLAIGAITLYLIAKGRNKLITRLCDTLMDKATLLQYGLRRTSNTSVRSKMDTFGDMMRGNYERDIADCYEGDFAGDEHHYGYEAYRLHYVDKEERSTYNSTEKRWETEVHYHHYDRSGIVLDFPYASGIHICNSFESTLYGSPYKPASLEFDKRFHCRGKDEMTLARFLKPAVVQALLDASKELGGLSVEINQNNQLCLSCSHYHIVNTTQKLTKETDPRVNPKGFDEHIRGNVAMPKLDQLLALAHTLMRFSDSNFSRKTA